MTPIYSCVGRQALSLSQGERLGPPVTVRHPTSERCPRLLCQDMTKQRKAEPLDAEQRSISAGRLPSSGASQGDQGKQG